MSVSIRIEAGSGLAIVSGEGLLGLDDAKAGAAALWETAGWAGKASVWDFRRAHFDLSSPEIREAASYVIRNQPAVPPERVAFVTGREVDFGLARIFEVMREDPRTAFRVFRDFDEAVDWARGAPANDT